MPCTQRGQPDVSGAEIINEASNGYALFANAGAQVEFTAGQISNTGKNAHAVQVNGEQTSVVMTDGLIENTINGSVPFLSTPDPSPLTAEP